MTSQMAAILNFCAPGPQRKILSLGIYFDRIFLPILHCQYSALDPQFRHLGIASLTAFRLAFALQQILPHSVSFYFNAISPKSWLLHLI